MKHPEPYPFSAALFASERLHRFSRGFSLTELLVVMAILAIMMALGAKALFSSNRNTILSSAAPQVASTISAARQLAITKNRKTRFAIIVTSSKSEWDKHRYGVLSIPEGDPPNIDNPTFEPVARFEDLPEGVYFRDNQHKGTGETGSVFHTTSDVDFGGNSARYAYIEFLPTGGTSSATGMNIFEMQRAPSADKEVETKDYIRFGVAQYTGRVKVERPEVK